MRVIDFENYIAEMPNLIKNHNETVLIKSDSPCILYGVDEFNNPNNFPTYNTHNFGGVIVNFDTDLCVVHCEVGGFDFGNDLMNSLKDWFVSKGLNATRSNNDVLVDGFKVASFMSSNHDGVIYSAAHISVKVDLEAIQQICTKPMVKIPRGLSDFGITGDEVRIFLERRYANG